MPKQSAYLYTVRVRHVRKAIYNSTYLNEVNLLSAIAGHILYE